MCKAVDPWTREVHTASAITLLEAFEVVRRRRGENAAFQAAAPMNQGKEIPLDGGLAIQAAQPGLESKPPMANGVVLATARAHRAKLWTQDDDLGGLGGVRCFSKPPSMGVLSPRRYAGVTEALTHRWQRGHQNVER